MTRVEQESGREGGKEGRRGGLVLSLVLIQGESKVSNTYESSLYIDVVVTEPATSTRSLRKFGELCEQQRSR
eukprot:scaffold1634_cov137-Amphora_coffeaeformis.AAC.10